MLVLIVSGGGSGGDGAIMAGGVRSSWTWRGGRGGVDERGMLDVSEDATQRACCAGGAAQCLAHV